MITERKVRKAIAYINKYCADTDEIIAVQRTLKARHFVAEGICKEEEEELLINRLFDKGFLEIKHKGYANSFDVVVRTNKCIYYEENRYEARDLTTRVMSWIAIGLSIISLGWSIGWSIYTHQ